MVVATEVVGERTSLICQGAGGTSTVSVSCVASTDRARALRRVMRVDAVDIVVCGSVISASLRGVGHRIPVRRSIPMAIALALIEDGVRAHVEMNDV